MERNKEHILSEATWDTVHSVVVNFYTKVRDDDLLREPFSVVEDWDEHNERMTHFWWQALGGAAKADLRFNPLPKHRRAGFDETKLARWLQLFDATVRDAAAPADVEPWLALAKRIGSGLLAADLRQRSLGIVG